MLAISSGQIVNLISSWTKPERRTPPPTNSFAKSAWRNPAPSVSILPSVEIWSLDNVEGEVNQEGRWEGGRQRREKGIKPVRGDATI